MIAAVLTKEMAATMTSEELVKACVDQVEAQHPGLNDEKVLELACKLFQSSMSEKHREEISLAGVMEIFDEVVAEHLDATAANLLSPRLREGKLFGVVAVPRDGDEAHVSIQFATVEHLENPFYLHHRAAYLQCARLLRHAGYDTYAAGYEAGLFTAKEGA